MKIERSVPEVVNLDEQRYLQVIYNLLGNALKYTFEGEIEVQVLVERRMLITNIKDTGVGIRDEQKQELFSYFG